MSDEKNTRQLDAAQSERINPTTVKRLLSYLKPYRAKLVLVTICIVISAIVSVASSLFLQTLIDDYIAPLLLEAVPDFSGLIHIILIMGCIYCAGALATLIYNRVMVSVAQGTLKRIRDTMFGNMQTLPIQYFDTHTHGDVMSHYTNDTDTLRQMIAQSLPQVISSAITIIAVFCAMLYVSIWLTLVVLVFVVIMLVVVGKIAGKSGSYFIAQQDSLGKLNGYVEEMVNGQKVVKVFCHEDESRETFREKNRVWCDNSTAANTYANVLMPIMNALGYILYIAIAIIGGYMAIAGTGNISLVGVNTLTLGMIASFLTLTRSFTNPLAQVSNQLNSIIMALAGATRIFKLMDEKPETDSGYVTLVNVEMMDGELRETEHHTGFWAWKHPHSDGTLTYTELKGHIVMENVDFGYSPEKLVLHDISIYAEPGEKVALVGSTGAGKTTITNLINRFYDIADGKIRYDGININKITLIGKRILLCEDHPINREIIVKLLEKEKLIIDTATDGKEGLEMFRHSKPGYYDAILMDLRMPVMDGITASKAIRALDRQDANTVPIIAITANVFETDIELCEEVGMNAHLAKPINPEELYATIAKQI